MPFWSPPKPSLRQRLSLGLGTMLVPLLILAGGAVLSFEKALDSFQNHEDFGRQALFPLAEVEGSLLDISSLTYQSQGRSTITLEAFRQKSQMINFNLVLILNHMRGKPTSYQSVRTIQQQWQQIESLCYQFFDEGQPSARAHRSKSQAELGMQLRAILQEVQRLHYRLIAFNHEANLEYAELVRERVRRLVTMIALSALVLAVLIAYSLSKSIMVPLKSLEEGVEQLGEGQMSHRIYLKTRDEFAHVAQMFNLMAAKLEQSQRDLARLATLDGLTEVYNRREFNRWLAVESERSQRYNQFFSLVMVDIDHFKQLNDTYGHHVGDLALCEVAQLLQREVRPGDIVCRYGGEEFGVILPKASPADGYAIAERIRIAILESPIILASQQKIIMTVSLGVATFPIDADTQECLIQRADQALYAAKHGGRNRVHQAGQTIPTTL